MQPTDMTISGLRGKAIIVTGGASGIGRATTQILLANGANVVIGDVSPAACESLRTQLSGDWADAYEVVETDVSDENAVQAMVDLCTGRFGRTDGAVNAAGVPPQQVLLQDMDAEQWHRCQAVNLTGQFYCIKYELRAIMASGRGGSIVSVSSASAEGAIPASGEYNASKAGLNGLLRSAALDAASENIRVNGIMPGAIQTPMFDVSKIDNDGFEQIIANVPLGRIAEPAEAAAVAVWLVSDLSSYVTGVMVPVDGGILMR